MPVAWRNSSSNRFLIGNLLGKLMFVDDDVRSGSRLPDGALKKLSEEKTMTGDRKFGNAFDFRCLALPVLLCNAPPSLGDLSHGMQRRLMVVPFERRFTGKAIDRSLFDDIWAAELPGILNMALEGLKRVIERGLNFQVPVSVQKAKKIWIVQSNPIPEFVSERCVKDLSHSEFTQDLYQAYVDWAGSNGYSMKQQRGTFERNLIGLGFTKGTKGNRGARIGGLRLK